MPVVRAALTHLPSMVARTAAAMILAAALVVVSAPRQATAETIAQPYSMIVRLQIRLPNGEVTCTGFMVGPHTVATAGHCLYNLDFGGWASSAFVTPGIDGLTAPYATEWATSFATSTAWVKTQELTADFGTITLATDAVGNATGWFDVAPPSNFHLAQGTFSTAGYGSSVVDGALWRMPRPEPLTDYDNSFLAYNWGTTTGVSGAPIFEPTPDSRYRAVGLVKGELTTGSSRVELGLRFTSDAMAFFREQVSRAAATPAPEAIPTMFTTPRGSLVRVTSPRTHANSLSVLQSSSDGVTWTTVANASTNDRGIATYTLSPTDTQYYRVVVHGLGTGRVGRGIVEEPTVGAPTLLNGPGSFATAPRYSPARVALAVYRGGTSDQLHAALIHHGAVAAWVQDGAGEWHLFVVNGSFINDSFREAFPDGFIGPSPMTLLSSAPLPLAPPPV